MTYRWIPRLKILTAALLFSTGGVAVKSCGLTSWQIGSFRCLLAAVAVWVLLPAARRRFTLSTLGVGAFQAGTLNLFVLANKTTTAANAVFLQSTAPLYVLLVAPLVLGERTRWRDVVVMAGMATGLVFFFLGDQQSSASAPAPFVGNVLAALAGICWAGTVIGLRSLERRGGSEETGAAGPSAVVAGSLLAGVAFLPMALPVESAQASDWGWIAYLGIFQVAGAYVLLISAMAEVPALEASLLILVEPTFSPVWAYLVHGEMPGPWAVAGGVLIVSVTVVKSLWDAYSPDAVSSA